MTLDGVCVFDGSTVTNISAALGNTRYTEANAGSSLGKYYISMKNETDGGYETFVYDLNTSLWVRLKRNAVSALYHGLHRVGLCNGPELYFP
ncbi:MAG: hypothetical protein V8Q01_09365 [Acutalibacteraceae bacterium]